MNHHKIGIGCCDYTDLEKGYVNEVLDSGRLSYGKFLKTFEQKFALAHDCPYGFMVNSGTSALSLSLACLKEVGEWKDGDQVICPALTFISSSNAIIMQNLEPVFVDVDPRTYNLDPDKVEEKITPKTRAILVVHQFGLPAEMDPLMDIASKHRLNLIEDSCETLFARYKSRSVGSFGDLGCFSTYMAHYIVTGVGGLVCTRHKDYIDIVKSLANHGRDNAYLSIDDDAGLTDEALRNVVEKRFVFNRLGYSYRCTELEGALGLAQLERCDEIMKPRKANALYLRDNLQPFEAHLQLPWWPDYADHSFMMFPMVIKTDAFKRIDLIMWLEKHHIETRVMHPLISQPFYVRRYGALEHLYPATRWINHNGFYIGCHQKITQRELAYIVETFHDFFRHNGLC
jgi:dTDP-4-amino-4,6-dideoxygalactose transaminase